MFNNDDEKDKKSSTQDKPVNVGVDITYTNEVPAEMGNISMFNPTTYCDLSYEVTLDNNNVVFGYISNTIGKDNLFDFWKIKEDYDNGLISIDEIYGNLKDLIIENKDNPIAIDSVVSNLLNAFNDFYDHNLDHKKIGNNTVEMLETIFSTPTGESLSGFVCLEIHEVVANLLNDCGINAAVVAGSMGGEGHATLIYQREDSKYVFNNYGKSYLVEQPNVKDAIRSIYAKSGSLESRGYLEIIDNYREFILKDDAAFGNEIDKRDYNSKSVFNNEIADGSSINVNINNSNLNNGNITLNAVYRHNNNMSSSLGLEYKNNKNGYMFDRSQSTGIKYELNTKQRNVFFNNKILYSNIRGTIQPSNTYTLTDSYMEQREQTIKEEFTEFGNVIESLFNEGNGIISTNPEFHVYMPTNSNTTIEQNHNVILYRGELGIESNIMKTNNSSTDNVIGISALLSPDIVKETVNVADVDFGSSITKTTRSCDWRIAIEDGVSFRKTSDDYTLNSGISAGTTFDYVRLGGKGGSGILPGVKVNEQVEYTRTFNPNTALSISENGYYTENTSCRELGLNVNTNLMRKVGNNVSVFAGMGASYENQHLSFGGFDETTENNITLASTIGVNIKNTTVGLNYSGRRSYSNPTRNMNCFSLGFNMKF